MFAYSGKPLGLIRQPGTANMGFAGKGLDTLYMLNDTTISYVKLEVRLIKGTLFCNVQISGIFGSAVGISLIGLLTL